MRLRQRDQDPLHQTGDPDRHLQRLPNRLYGTIYGDVGDAWNGALESKDLKKDVGAGLRVQLHSFYSYPTAVAFDVAYGFDRFTHVENDVATRYGRELRYYLTILFDFYSPFSAPTGSFVKPEF